jgi:hypothetical protein
LVDDAFGIAGANCAPATISVVLEAEPQRACAKLEPRKVNDLARTRQSCL